MSPNELPVKLVLSPDELPLKLVKAKRDFEEIINRYRGLEISTFAGDTIRYSFITHEEMVYAYIALSRAFPNHRFQVIHDEMICLLEI